METQDWPPKADKLRPVIPNSAKPDLPKEPDVSRRVGLVSHFVNETKRNNLSSLIPIMSLCTSIVAMFFGILLAEKYLVSGRMWTDTDTVTE